MGSRDFLQSRSEEGFQAGGSPPAGSPPAGSPPPGSPPPGSPPPSTPPATPPSTSGCGNTQNMILNSDNNFFNWHNEKDEMLNGFIQKKGLSPRDKRDIQLIRVDIESVVNCLTTKIQASSSRANDIFKMQEQLISLQEKIDRESENTQIAKDRMEYSKEPVKYSSYYSSWFPATRPLYYITIIVLLSVSLFIGMFGLLFLLSLIGVDLSFFKNNMYEGRFETGFMFASQYTTPLLIAVSVGLLIYIFVRK